MGVRGDIRPAPELCFVLEEYKMSVVICYPRLSCCSAVVNKQVCPLGISKVPHLCHPIFCVNGVCMQ